MNKIGYIQALRALAVMLVVGYHYKGIIPLFKHGYLGVDLFFVICGFIMVYTTRNFTNNKSDIKLFVIKRFSRIWPVYSVLTVLFFVIFLPSIPGDVVAQVKWVVKCIMFYPYWNVLPVVQSGWTLPLEVLFYIMFAMSMFAGKWRWLALAAIMVLTMVVLNIKSIYYTYGSYNFPGVYLFTVTSEINWCFYIGAIAGLVSVKSIRINRRIYEAVLFVVVVVFLIALTSDEQPPHGLMIGLMFGLMVFSIDGINSGKEIKIPRGILAIGDMSFSIYLCHDFVLEIYARHFDKFAVGLHMKLALFIPYVAASIILGWLSWKYLENGLAVWVRDCLMGKNKGRGQLQPASK